MWSTSLAGEDPPVWKLKAIGSRGGSHFQAEKFPCLRRHGLGGADGDGFCLRCCRRGNGGFQAGAAPPSARIIATLRQVVDARSARTESRPGEAETGILVVTQGHSSRGKWRSSIRFQRMAAEGVLPQVADAVVIGVHRLGGGWQLIEAGPLGIGGGAGIGVVESRLRRNAGVRQRRSIADLDIVEAIPAGEAISAWAFEGKLLQMEPLQLTPTVKSKGCPKRKVSW